MQERSGMQAPGLALNSYFSLSSLDKLKTVCVCFSVCVHQTVFVCVYKEAYSTGEVCAFLNVSVCAHSAREVALHQPLGVELGFEAADKGHEVIHGEALHDGLVLLDDRPATVFQDQQTHIPERGRGKE